MSAAGERAETILWETKSELREASKLVELKLKVNSMRLRGLDTSVKDTYSQIMARSIHADAGDRSMRLSSPRPSLPFRENLPEEAAPTRSSYFSPQPVTKSSKATENSSYFYSAPRTAPARWQKDVDEIKSHAQALRRPDLDQRLLRVLSMTWGGVSAPGSAPSKLIDKANRVEKTATASSTGLQQGRVRRILTELNGLVEQLPVSPNSKRKDDNSATVPASDTQDGETVSELKGRGVLRPIIGVSNVGPHEEDTARRGESVGPIRRHLFTTPPAKSTRKIHAFDSARSLEVSREDGRVDWSERSSELETREDNTGGAVDDSINRRRRSSLGEGMRMSPSIGGQKRASLGACSAISQHSDVGGSSLLGNDIENTMKAAEEESEEASFTFDSAQAFTTEEHQQAELQDWMEAIEDSLSEKLAQFKDMRAELSYVQDATTFARRGHASSRGSTPISGAQRELW